MTTRRHSLARLRVLVLAVVLAAGSSAAAAAPVRPEAPSGDASPFSGIVKLAGRLFAPRTAVAAFCADNPGFSGYLTASPTSHAAVSEITNSHVYAYISRVNDDWSCTAYLRYDGVAWNTTASKGRFDWGLLITSTSVPCNYSVGSNDFIKGNPTADCDDSDAEYALDVALSAQRVYQQDVNHDTIGDLSFVHADCGTVYGGGDGEALSGTEADPESFSATNVANRPGANCDPITLDGFQTTQSVTYDATPPVLNFDAPAADAVVHSGSYTVQFDVSDAVAKFGGSDGWKLQRQVAPITQPAQCGPFTDNVYDLVDPATGVTTAEGSNTQRAQVLSSGSCYQWVLTATDENGNAASLTSKTLIVDDATPIATFATPMSATSTARNTSPYSVAWTETTFGLPIASRSLQRQRVAISGSACGTLWANDGSAATGASPVSATLTSNYCYQWLLTVTDSAGRVSAQATSGTVMYNTAWPAADVSTPDEGTTTRQASASYSVAWTETWGSGGSAHATAPRSLQRQRGTVVTASSCAGVNWATDGSPDTGVSPRSATGLANGYAYRWIQTLRNSANLTGAVTSGCVIVDSTPPAGAISAPAASTALTGAVDITGTASDATSFSGYTLEVGAGPAPSSWTTIGTYASPVTSVGVLGTWYPGTLSGIHTIRLTVTDAAGNTPSVTTRTVVLENAMRGEEHYLSRVPYDLGGGLMLDVGVANGETRLSRHLASIPSYGPAQELMLTYSSADTEATGRFGWGWSSNLTQYLVFDLANAVTTWHRADGGRVPFGLVGGTWTPPRGHDETLAVSGSEVTITTKDQTRYVFESSGAGLLKRIENRFGKALTILWSASGAAVEDASDRGPTENQTVNIAYDSGNARISSFTDYAGRTWTFGYTGTGASSDLTCITDPASKVTRLGYTSHALTSIVRGSAATCTSGGDTTWSVAYTGGKVSSVASPLYASTPDLFTYGSGTATWRQVIATTGPSYADTTWTLDPRGRGWALHTADPAGAGTSRTFDADGNVLTEGMPSDEGDLAATFEYDARGNLTREVRVLDRTTTPVTTAVTRSTYNTTNDLTSRTDADNVDALRTVTRLEYDAAGHLTSETRNCTSAGTTIPGEGQGGACTGAGTQDAETNIITRYSWTANDQLESEQDPRGFVTKHVYDTHGNETAVIANCTSSGTTPPDPFDSCTAILDANGTALVNAGTQDASTNVLTTTAYDTGTVAGKAGLPTSSADPLGRTTSYTYDAMGRQLTEALPGDASTPVLTRTTTYDLYGSPLTEVEAWTPAGGSSQTRTTTHAYDLEQRETSVIDPYGTRTSTTYDPADNALSQATQDTAGTVTATTTRWTYDKAGNQTSELLDGASADTSPATTTHTLTRLPLVALAPDGSGTETTYRLDGLATAVTALEAGSGAEAGSTTTTLDALGRETATDDEDPGSAADTETTYDRLGRVRTTAAGGLTTTFTYDRAGNQVSVTDPAGIVTTTTYDALGRATTVIANDVAGQSTLPGEDITTTTWFDAAGNTIAATDALGITTRSILDVRDRVVRTIANCTDTGTTPTGAPAACTGTGQHDATTNLITDTEFDGQGNAVKTTTAVGLTGSTATTETAYDVAGRVHAAKDANGTVTRSDYDDFGRLTDTYVNCTTSGTVIPADWAGCTGGGTADGTFNLHTTFSYDEWGNEVARTAPNGRVTTRVYDESNRLVATIDNDVASPTGPAQDVTTTLVYDAAGRQAAVVAASPTGSGTTVTRTIHNDDGTVAQVIANCVDAVVGAPAECTGTGTKNADTNVITNNTYDPEGRPVAVTAPDPSATTGIATATVTTQYAYDDAGRLCRVVENATGGTDLASPELTHPCTDATQTAGTTTANTSTRYGYDAAGSLASMTDARGNTTTYGYDAAGHMTARTDALGGDLVWTFDALGNRITQRNRTDTAPSVSVTWTYDPFGRILTRTADSTTTTSTYDLAGNRLTATTGAMTITATYDRLGRVLTVDDEDAGTTPDTSYTWAIGTGDPVSTPSWTDPSGSYTAVLDTFDRPTAMTDPVSASGWTTTYGAAGQVTGATAGNGNTVASTFDATGRELTRTTTDGGTTRAAYTWTHNRAGLVLSEASTITGDPANGTIGYGYDPLGRLTASGATGYTWDATANRTGSGASTTAFDAANRPTSGTSPTASYSSDADGQLLTRPGQSMTWDHLGRLVSVTTASGTTSYTYDPLDRLRTVTVPGGAVTRFRYTGLTTSAAQLLDATGTVTRSIGSGWGGERLLDWVPGSDRRYHGTNAHHDTTWLADATGAVISALRYDPWGVPRSAVPAGFTPFRFQGSWHDTSTDLAWVVTRWYAPSLGTFTSEDSLLGEPRDPDSRHLYAYAQGEPVGSWDPDGRRGYRVSSFIRLWGLADKTLGSMRLWPMLVNANRQLLAATASSWTIVRPFTCIDVPVSWLASPVARLVATMRALSSPCSVGGRSSAYSLDDHSRGEILAGQRGARIGDPRGAFSYTRAALVRATEATIGDRVREPDSGDGALYARRLAGQNAYARRKIGSSRVRGPGVVVDDVNGEPVFLSEVRVVYGRGPFFCTDRPCTVGQYIFVGPTRKPYFGLFEHEYVHILQWEGRSGEFARTYLDDLIRGGGYSARLPLEGVAYLWQYHSRLGREPAPWDIWQPVNPFLP